MPLQRLVSVVSLGLCIAGMWACSGGTVDGGGGPSDTEAPVTSASPAPGTYQPPLDVLLTASEAATIYYSTNGPASQGSLNGPSPVPLTLTASTTLSFFSVDAAGNVEPLQTIDYVIDGQAPTSTASPAGKAFQTPADVTITADEPATIYYTIDGTTPTKSSTNGASPVTITLPAADTTLTFFAVDAVGNEETPAKVESYVFDDAAPVTSVTPTGGTFNSAFSAVISADEPATIYYTLDGSEPTTASTSGASPVTVGIPGADTTLSFFGVDAVGNQEASPNVEVYVYDTQPPVSSADTTSRPFNTAFNVTLSADEPATIYYTLDGSTPSPSSLRAMAPVTVNIPTVTTTLQFYAVDTAGNSESSSHALTFIYDPQPPSSTADIGSRAFNASFNVALSADEAATIHYTTDGTTPTTSSPSAPAPTTVTIPAATTVLSFFAVDTAGNAESPVNTETYTYDAQAPTSSIDIGARDFNASFDVGISVDETAVIFYTTDGSTPDTSSQSASAPLTLTIPAATTTLQFFAVDPAGNVENVQSVTYTFDDQAPTTTANVPGRDFNAAFELIINADEAATIYYTTDGTAPSLTSTAVTAPATVAITAANTTVRFFGVDPAGNVESPDNSETYTFDDQAPTTTPSVTSLVFNAAFNVVLTADEAATIFYTLDGNAPTTSSTSGASPLTVGIPAATTTLRFFAMDPASNQETPQSEVYTFDNQPPSTSATVATSRFNAAFDVTLNADETATIYYTLDGEDPTTSSTSVSNGSTVSIPAADTTLKFFGVDPVGNIEGTIHTEAYDYAPGSVAGTLTLSTAVGAAPRVELSTSWPVAGAPSESSVAVMSNATTYTYDIPFAEDGTYYVVVYLDHDGDGGTPELVFVVDATSPLVLDDSQRNYTGIDLALIGSIAGTIDVSDAPALVPQVLLYDNAGFAGVPVATVDATGSGVAWAYQADFLEAGTYYALLSIDHDGDAGAVTPAIESAYGRWLLGIPAALDITGGNPVLSSIDFDLSGALTGTISANQTVAGHVDITVYEAGLPENALYTVEVPVPGAAASYTIAYMEPGNYQVRAFADQNETGAWDAPADEDGALVTVLGGLDTTLNLNFTFPVYNAALGTISGTVSLLNEVGVGIQMVLFDENPTGPDTPVYALTGADGAIPHDYTFINLPDGDYYILAWIDVLGNEGTGPDDGNDDLQAFLGPITIDIGGGAKDITGADFAFDNHVGGIDINVSTNLPFGGDVFVVACDPVATRPDWPDCDFDSTAIVPMAGVLQGSARMHHVPNGSYKLFAVPDLLGDGEYDTRVLAESSSFVVSDDIATGNVAFVVASGSIDVAISSDVGLDSVVFRFCDATATDPFDQSCEGGGTAPVFGLDTGSWNIPFLSAGTYRVWGIPDVDGDGEPEWHLGQVASPDAVVDGITATATAVSFSIPLGGIAVNLSSTDPILGDIELRMCPPSAGNAHDVGCELVDVIVGSSLPALHTIDYVADGDYVVWGIPDVDGDEDREDVLATASSPIATVDAGPDPVTTLAFVVPVGFIDVDFTSNQSIASAEFFLCPTTASDPYEPECSWEGQADFGALSGSATISYVPNGTYAVWVVPDVDGDRMYERQLATRAAPDAVVADAGATTTAAFDIPTGSIRVNIDSTLLIDGGVSIRVCPGATSTPWEMGCDDVLTADMGGQLSGFVDLLYMADGSYTVWGVPDVDGDGFLEWNLVTQATPSPTVTAGGPTSTTLSFNIPTGSIAIDVTSNVGIDGDIAIVLCDPAATGIDPSCVGQGSVPMQGQSDATVQVPYVEDGSYSVWGIPDVDGDGWAEWWLLTAASSTAVISSGGSDTVSMAFSIPLGSIDVSYTSTASIAGRLRTTFCDSTATDAPWGNGCFEGPSVYPGGTSGSVSVVGLADETYRVWARFDLDDDGRDEDHLLTEATAPAVVAGGPASATISIVVGSTDLDFTVTSDTALPGWVVVSLCPSGAAGPDDGCMGQQWIDMAGGQNGAGTFLAVTDDSYTLWGVADQDGDGDAWELADRLTATEIAPSPLVAPGGPTAGSIDFMLQPDPSLGTISGLITGLPSVSGDIEIFGHQGDRWGPVVAYALATPFGPASYEYQLFNLTTDSYSVELRADIAGDDDGSRASENDNVNLEYPSNPVGVSTSGSPNPKDVTGIDFAYTYSAGKIAVSVTANDPVLGEVMLTACPPSATDPGDPNCAAWGWASMGGTSGSAYLYYVPNGTYSVWATPDVDGDGQIERGLATMSAGTVTVNDSTESISVALTIPGGRVTVSVSSNRPIAGWLRVELCSPTAPPGMGCDYSKMLTLPAAGTDVVFPAVADGQYVAWATFDLDGDGNGEQYLMTQSTGTATVASGSAETLSLPIILGTGDLAVDINSDTALDGPLVVFLCADTAPDINDASCNQMQWLDMGGATQASTTLWALSDGAYSVWGLYDAAGDGSPWDAIDIALATRGTPATVTMAGAPQAVLIDIAVPTGSLSGTITSSIPRTQVEVSVVAQGKSPPTDLLTSVVVTSTSPTTVFSYDLFFLPDGTYDAWALSGYDTASPSPVTITVTGGALTEDFDFDSPQAPEFAFPSWNAVTEESTITVRGRWPTAPWYAKEVRVNGVVATPIGGFTSWTATVDLNPGANELAVDVELDDSTIWADILTRTVHRKTLVDNIIAHTLADDGQTAYIVDGPRQSLLALDTATEASTLILGQGTGSGATLIAPTDLEYDPVDGRVWLVDGDVTPGESRLIRVDVTTGVAAVISDASSSGAAIGVWPSLALDLANSRVLVTDDTNDAVVAISTVDGSRTIISDDSSAGTAFVMPRGIAMDPNRSRALVVDYDWSAPDLVAVNLTTGARTNGASSFTAFRPVDIVVSGDLAWITDPQGESLYEVDLASNASTRLSCSFISDAQGAGPLMRHPTTVAFQASSGRVLMLSFERSETHSGLMWVDRPSGDRTEFTAGGAGTGPVVGNLDLTFDGPAETAYVAGNEQVMLVDLASGDRDVVISRLTGNNPQLVWLRGIAHDEPGDRLFMVTGNYDVYQVNLTTGMDTFLHDNTIGESTQSPGPGFEYGIDGVGNPRLLFAEDQDVDYPISDEPALYEYNLSTGARVPLSTQWSGGWKMVDPKGMAPDFANNRVYVADNDRLMTVSLTGSGARFSDSGIGSGPVWIEPWGLTYDGLSEVVVTERNATYAGGRVFSIDVGTRDRTVVSSDTVGSGPPLRDPREIRFDSADRTVLMLDHGWKALMQLDLQTGARVIVAR